MPFSPKTNCFSVWNTVQEVNFSFTFPKSEGSNRTQLDFMQQIYYLLLNIFIRWTYSTEISSQRMFWLAVTDISN